MSIRPISSRFPLSKSVWEETGLPLCAVLAPLEDPGEDEESNEDGRSEKGRGGAAADSCAQPIEAVPKCLYCGAPHVTATTHFRPSKLSSRLLCYFCGETSSTMLTDQQEVRENETLDPDVYDKIPFFNPRDVLNQKDEDEDDVPQVPTETFEFRVPVDVQKMTEVVTTRKGKRRIVKEQKETMIPTWQLPAMACPPVWWIVVDGTVGGRNNTLAAARNYWSTVGATLTRTIEAIPPHVHVGLVTATASRLANWDLASAVPHVKQFPYSYDPMLAIDDGEGEKSMSEEKTAWDLSLVPANGHYKANLLAAIRAMVDGAGRGVFMGGDEDDDDDDDDDGHEEKKSEDEQPGNFGGQGLPLALTTEIILEFMEQAHHPGQQVEEDEDDDDDDDDSTTQLRYAGGKILCLLGNPPLETATPPSDDSMSYFAQPEFGFGGVAGTCCVEDDIVEEEQKQASRLQKRSSEMHGEEKEDEEDVDEPTDLTHANIKDYAMPLEPDDLFAMVGKRCAKAALGVDIFALVPQEDDGLEGRNRCELYNSNTEEIPWYGLPLLRPLSERSGAPGPLMFGTANIGSVEDRGNNTKHSDAFERLHENVLARTPWQNGMVFGVAMGLRLPSGFRVEKSPVDVPNSQLELSRYLYSKGITGSAVACADVEEYGKRKVAGFEEDDNIDVWIMGTCDPHTSFTVDLETVGSDELPDSVEMQGFGEVELKPLMQTCTRYTCIETDGAEPTPNYYTVCKMRVSNVSMEYTDNAESIFDGLDTEAVSTVLFNKLALEAYTVGLAETQEVAESWLQRILEAVYESAQAELAYLEEEEEEEEEKDSEEDSNFKACDRLLDYEGGELDKTEVLMGAGHSKVKSVPLLVYALMNCDALRPSNENFKPSMDARLCAIAQLTSMTPKNMAKILAPSLSLWSLRDDRPVLDSLPLRREGILAKLDALDEDSKKDTILLLDSLQRVVFFDGVELGGSKGRTNESRSIEVGTQFESRVLSNLRGYRTAPLNSKAVERILDEKGGSLTDVGVSRSVLLSMLIEDKATNRGDSNFNEWKSRIAKVLREKFEIDEEKTTSKGRLRRMMPF